jgi:hypothetical protein
MYGTQDAQITIDSITGFTIGFAGVGSGQGFVYNNVYIGAIVDFKIALDLESVSYSEAVVCVNENRFFGGHIAFGASTGPLNT